MRVHFQFLALEQVRSGWCCFAYHEELRGELADRADAAGVILGRRGRALVLDLQQLALNQRVRVPRLRNLEFELLCAACRKMTGVVY